MNDAKNKRMKIAIIVLAVLFAISAALLAGTFIMKYLSDSEPTSSVAPDNTITPDPDEGTTPPAQTPEVSGPGKEPSPTVAGKKGAPLVLSKRKHSDNAPFQAGNMFPGDAEKKYYGVKVYYKDDVVVRYHADIRPGGEKLAEVMQVQVRLPDTGEVLYEGLMRDMPRSVDYSLKTDQSAKTELYYEITAWLDTGVGNAYMNQDLIADFRWWVEETDHLDPPETGDLFHAALWICIASGALLLLILLLKKRPRGAKEDE